MYVCMYVSCMYVCMYACHGMYVEFSVVMRQVDLVQLDPVGLEHQDDVYCSVLASTKSDPLLGQFQILKHYDNCLGGTAELDSGDTCGNDQPCKCIHKQLFSKHPEECAYSRWAQLK